MLILIIGELVRLRSNGEIQSLLLHSIRLLSEE